MAKNYLTAAELDVLNRTITIYLEFAELQALSQRPIDTRDWIAKLDQLLQVSEREGLEPLGTVSHDVAAAKAKLEFEKYTQEQAALPSAVERDFAAPVAKTSALAKATEAAKAAPRAKKAGCRL